MKVFMMDLPRVGYKKSIDLLYKCSSEHGFYASSKKRANYRRVWARDGVITGLAALLTGEERLINAFRKTLDTLLKFQGRQGEIPSNVSPESKRVSYGTLAGRVDSPLWYVLGCVKYYNQTRDQEFLDLHYPAIVKVISLLESWEFNQRGFIFVPRSGDWADEMPRQGYLLYDQVLYYQALTEFIKIRKVRGDSFSYWVKKKNKLKRRIEVNFGPDKVEKKDRKYIYHQAIFDKLNKNSSYWIESFDVETKRFDFFANSLVILFGLSTKEQSQKIIEYATEISQNSLIPAFYPIIKRGDKDWEELQVSFLFEFKNKPYLNHNGGLWPMINGFYAAALRRSDRKDLAEHCLEEITKANYLDRREGGSWGFYEYLHGKKKTPEGTPYMAWNAAGQIFAFKSGKII